MNMASSLSTREDYRKRSIIKRNVAQSNGNGGSSTPSFSSAKSKIMTPAYVKLPNTSPTISHRNSRNTLRII